ncbi:MAG: YCF48-related protein [Thermoleophilia bacterium]
MKRLITFKSGFALAVLIALVFAMPALSAGLITGSGGWQWTNPSVQGNTLNSVSFVDDNLGYAAGIGGTVIKTTDGGANWTAKIPLTSCGAVPTAGCNLNGIHFISANEGWVVGDYGTIWHTTSGGDSWTSQNSGLPASGCAGGGTCASTWLKDVYFADATYGIAVGDGYAFGTVDGGATWSKISTISTARYLSSVQLLNNSTAVIVGSDGFAFRVTRSGAVWTAVEKTTPTNEALRSVFFVDTANGFAVGGGKLIRSNDGGNTWGSEAGTVAGGTTQLWGVTVSGNDLIVTGGTAGAGNGAIFRRTSATNWSDSISAVADGLTATSMGTTNQILAVAMPSTGTGFAAGEAGAVTKTTSSGSAWTLVAGGNSKAYSGASFVDDTTGWMVAMDGTVLKTVDGGDTWTGDNAGIASGTNLQAVHFLDEGMGFAVGFSGSNGVAYKYRSGTWTAMTVPADVGSLWGIHMTSATTGWAVGIPAAGATTGVALRTTDGSTWVNTATGITSDIQLYGVDTTDPSTNGWAVGQRAIPAPDYSVGILAKYSGGSWTYVEKADSSFFSSIDMADGNTGYAVGYDGGPPAAGRGYKTIDGGASWNSMTMGTSKLLSEVSFIDASTGYASGDEGRVLKTVNGGTNWTLESVGSSVGMTAIVAIPSSFAPSGIAAFIGGFNAAAMRSVENNEVTSVSTSGVRVARGDNVSATFSRDLDAATIVSPATSFTIKRQSDSVPVPGTVSCDTPCRTATFDPDADLDYATTYEATLTTAITGADMAPLQRNYTWTFSTARDYWWTWYDNQSTGAQDWVLMANPDSATQSLKYRLSIAGTDRSLTGWNNGVVAPGGNSLTPQYPTVIGGPVNAASIIDGSKGIVSQRILWGQNSLEEVLGTDAEKLSNHFYWTWYDDLSSGYTNYVMVANPGTATVYFRIKIAGDPQADFPGMPSSGSIAPGESAFWRDGSKQGGPVEVEAWSDGVDGSTPADVLASQRVLSNGNSAFNEVPGIPVSELSNRYVWTWYDNHTPGATDWIMIANHNLVPMYYEIRIGGVVVQDDVTGGGPIAAGSYVSPFFPAPGVPAATGPVEVRTYEDSGHLTPINSIASQRVIWGPSFEEVPGYPYSALTNTYHWTWYDQSQANVFNWVMVAKQDETATNVYYKVLVAGVERKACTQIPDADRDYASFAGVIGGPVEVRSYSDAGCTVASAPGNGIMASQRVLWNGFFNETLGTVLN